MPTANPRIAITLQPYRYDLLKRLAGLQGVSMAALVCDLLDEFYPVLERVCVALEMAQTAQESSRAGIKEAAIRAEEEMQPIASAVMNQFDMFMTEVQTHFAADDKGGSPAGGTHGGGAPLPAVPEASNPRVVTRGSGTKTRKPLQPAKPNNTKASRRSSPRGASK